jgi:antitoxin (DNA-binding transcriptional repressor) of toxin-antitoxin stability system
MPIVNIAEAKAQLSELAARASRGEEIILAHIAPAAPERGFGGRGDFTIPDNFDEPLAADILESFGSGTTFSR